MQDKITDKKTLRECVAEAMNRKVAVGHFNISNVEGFWAVVRAAQEMFPKSRAGNSQSLLEFQRGSEIL